MTILSFDAMSGSLSRGSCALGGEGVPISEDARAGDRISWTQALERASVSACVVAPTATGLAVTDSRMPEGQARPSGRFVEAVSSVADGARTGAQPQWRGDLVRTGEDPAWGAHPVDARRRRHAGLPIAEPCPVPLDALSSTGANGVAATHRTTSRQDAEPRRFAADAATLRIHVETGGDSASVWIGVDAGATHLLDDAVAAVSRWLMRDGCAEARWICNGRPLEALRFARSSALDPTSHGGATPFAGPKPRSAGGAR